MLAFCLGVFRSKNSSTEQVSTQMSRRFTKKELVGHPVVQCALKELHISPRRLKLSHVKKHPNYNRGLSYMRDKYAIIRVNACDNLDELLWVTLHELRHLWQFRRGRMFIDLDKQEHMVLRALCKAYRTTPSKVMERFHDALPTEVDANIYATLKLGKDFSSYALEHSH